MSTCSTPPTSCDCIQNAYDNAVQGNNQTNNGVDWNSPHVQPSLQGILHVQDKHPFHPSWNIHSVGTVGVSRHQNQVPLWLLPCSSAKRNTNMNVHGDINVSNSLNSIQNAKINLIHLYICTTHFVLFVLWLVSCHGNHSYSVLCAAHTELSEYGCHG